MTWTVEAHPPVYLPGKEKIVSAKDEADADRLARELSARPELLKAWTYRDGVLVAEYGMGFKFEI